MTFVPIARRHRDADIKIELEETVNDDAVLV